MSKHRRHIKPKLSLFDKRFRAVAASDAQIKIIQSTRRQGKTTFITKDAIRKALSKPSQIVICAYSYSLAIYAFNIIVDQIKGLKCSLIRAGCIKFENGSEIQVLSTASESRWRGKRADYLYVDDAEAIREQYWEYILPTISEGGNLLITTTPDSAGLHNRPTLERLYKWSEVTPNSFFHWPVVGEEREKLEALFSRPEYSPSARDLIGDGIYFIEFDATPIA